ncbi:Transcription factor RFX4 [Armadillidium nasatum]|uniref:Transcription factor RFX4 n=1 Tax=Armadillidium nasatum TaxID=96803 RepID=A0A5N5SSD7_9CRUS|nr:Transcription factor RFX4 [Armadillidium nasatum]
MVSGDGGGGTPSGETGGGGVGAPNLDAEAQANIAHATRVSPQTVQWLLDNYETAEGVSLPRSTLYNHYLYHCADHKLDPVNSASFGKLIRSVFMGLRTRRLGTRGNSKYHYYGIRVKPNSSLNNLSEDGTPLNIRNQGGQVKKTPSGQGGQETSHHTHQQGRNVSSTGNIKSNDPYDSQAHMGSEAISTGDVTRALPILPEINLSNPIPAGVSKQHFENFRAIYQEHCENVLEVIYNLQFHLMETVWRRFWGLGNNNNVISSDKNNVNEVSDEDEGELASKFPSNVLQNMLRSPAILEFMKNVDYQFYQNIVEVLIPDVLRSIPSTLTQSIRNFAKSLELWLSNALMGYPAEAIEVKITAVASLAQTLRRYTSLNHLAQAARAVLQNSNQITQMLSDLNRVDFHNVQEQASWVCQCDVSLVERLKEDFKATLQQQNSLEQWAEWLQTVVDQTLTPQEGSPDFSKHARQFLLKWSFYSSMVIRDLTLRSAASFGSFHLIRLLYDEYMFYLVEHKVASSLGLTPIAVMSQFLSTAKVQNIGEGNFSLNGDESTVPAIKRPKYEDS